MKRFYKTTAAEQRVGGAVVLLDGRVLKTPAKRDMMLPNLALAQAIAEEWAAQGESIQPQTMPLMKLAATALDRVAIDASHATADIVRYSGSDLLCYRADMQAELALRQEEVWQPLLDWFQGRYDLTLRITKSIMAVEQPPELADRLHRLCAGLDPLRLTALHTATTVCGSVVIGLALLEGHLSSDAAYEAAFLDELHQAGLWGEDEEAAERRADLKAEIAALERFLKLL
ncbi:ATP12 family chaperone protein [Ferrovibrio sp.]|uniref:ATP12 family chaperone protein n=1 Tax=Ferrovibrio sp. TaxID=1917215 RepID=UPI003D09A2A0